VEKVLVLILFILSHPHRVIKMCENHAANLVLTKAEKCPYCGSCNTEFVKTLYRTYFDEVEDEVLELWRCLDCGEEFQAMHYEERWCW